MKKLLFVNSAYYPNTSGGAQKSVKILAESFSGEFEVHVLTLSENAREDTINGVRVHYINTPNVYEYSNRHSKSNVLIKVLWHLIDHFPILRNRSNLVRKINEISPDIAITNVVAGFSVDLFKMFNSKGIPIIHVVRDYYMICLKSTMLKEGPCNGICTECRLSKNIKKLRLKSISHFVFLTNAIREIHLKEINQIAFEATSIIGNSADYYDFSIKSRSRPVFGFIGRIHPTKGLEDLLETGHKLNYSVDLILAGGGESKYIDELMKKFDACPNLNTSYLGFTNPFDFYSKIDYLVVPSKWIEPFGRVVIEALQSGIPVILPRIKSFIEIAKEADAYFYDINDSNSFKDAIDSAYRNYPTSVNKEYYRDSFSVETIKNKYTAIIDKF